MGARLKRTAGVLGIGTVAVAVAVGVASRRWHVATQRLNEQLRGLATVPAGTVSFAELASLPAPVQRYFRTVLRDGQPLILSAEIAQAGDFRSKESPDPEAGWRPFQAAQLFTAEPPGFVWDACIRMVPLASVRVRDAYVGGRASMLGAVLGIVRVVEAADDTQLRAGALQRYLAESVWFPTALLPREGLRWTPIDNAHARATLTDGDTAATLEFEFGPNGEMVGCYTPSRQRAAPGEPGRYHTLPWGGRYRRYEERAGVRVPLESEVYWVVDGMEQPYYRGRNLQFTFDLGERE